MALEPITRQEKIIAGQDLTPITRMEKFLKQYGGGSGGVTSWNDLTDKPFGETTTVKEVLAECQPEFVAAQGMFALNSVPDIEAGAEYIVNWNGVEYKCTAVQTAEDSSAKVIALGNLSATGGENTGEPFTIGANYGEQPGCFVIPLDGSTTLTISIRQEVTEVKKISGKYVEGMGYEEDGVVHPIDEKYLPSGIGGECDWNTMKNRPFDKEIDTSWYGETIIESLTATVDENGAKTIYGDEYGFEMNLPFDTGDNLCISVVSQEDGETYLYSSKGAAYEAGQDVYSSIVKANFEIEGRTVSVSVSNTAGYMTVINLSGFEPNSEVKFGLHHALVEYRPIDMRYLPTTVMSTDKAVYGFFMKNNNDQTFYVSVSDDGQLVCEPW